MQVCTLAGTQDKIGLFVDGDDLADDSRWYVPEGGAPSNAILKVASPGGLSDLMIAGQIGVSGRMLRGDALLLVESALGFSDWANCSVGVAE